MKRRLSQTGQKDALYSRIRAWVSFAPREGLQRCSRIPSLFQLPVQRGGVVPERARVASATHSETGGHDTRASVSTKCSASYRLTLIARVRRGCSTFAGASAARAVQMNRCAFNQRSVGLLLKTSPAVPTCKSIREKERQND